jgi:hypothetical protein
VLDEGVGLHEVGHAGDDHGDGHAAPCVVAPRGRAAARRPGGQGCSDENEAEEHRALLSGSFQWSVSSIQLFTGKIYSRTVHQHGYRANAAADLEGHHWTFAQARPTMLG